MLRPYLILKEPYLLDRSHLDSDGDLKCAQDLSGKVASFLRRLKYQTNVADSATDSIRGPDSLQLAYLVQWPQVTPALNMTRNR
jgi:hypothetical protein